MFARLYTLFVALFFAIPLLASASALPRGGGNACTTGEVQCCDSVQNSGSNGLATTLLGLLGVVVGSVGVDVGITCSPLSVIGVGGNSCSAQTVCCANNSFNGVIAVGCTPLNVGL
ncbi:hydrophobin-251 [Desarmillaria ectypa]|nr:hydrophobin-251 [Desarmillaria ectypa]